MNTKSPHWLSNTREFFNAGGDRRAQYGDLLKRLAFYDDIDTLNRLVNREVKFADIPRLEKDVQLFFKHAQSHSFTFDVRQLPKLLNQKIVCLEHAKANNGCVHGH